MNCCAGCGSTKWTKEKLSISMDRGYILICDQCGAFTEFVVTNRKKSDSIWDHAQRMRAELEGQDKASVERSNRSGYGSTREYNHKAFTKRHLEIMLAHGQLPQDVRDCIKDALSLLGAIPDTKIELSTYNPYDAGPKA